MTQCGGRRPRRTLVLAGVAFVLGSCGSGGADDAVEPPPPPGRVDTPTTAADESAGAIDRPEPADTAPSSTSPSADETWSDTFAELRPEPHRNRAPTDPLVGRGRWRSAVSTDRPRRRRGPVLVVEWHRDGGTTRRNGQPRRDRRLGVRGTHLDGGRSRRRWRSARDVAASQHSSRTERGGCVPRLNGPRSASRCDIGDRNRETKRRTRSGRFDDDVAPVRSRQAASDRQSDPPSGLARPGPGPSIEPFEDGFDLVDGNPRPGVDHVDECQRRSSTSTQGDRATGRGVAECVAEQVRQHLCQPPGVAANRDRFGRLATSRPG